VAYVRNFREDIWVRDLSNGSDTRVTFTDGNAVAPDWDPSGRYIVYARVFHDYGTPDSTAGLHIVDTNTLTDTVLRHSGEVTFGFNPRWSPDSLTIAFSSIVPWNGVGTVGNAYHIVSVKAEGTDYRDLTPNERRNNQYPVWLNGSTTLLFESYLASSFNVHETQVINADGSGRRSLPFDIRYAIGFAAVAPAAGLCVYSGLDPSREYYVLVLRALEDASGSTARQLTSFTPPAPSARRLVTFASRRLGPGRTP
jgi:Tol biopolymer transport system component